MSFVRCFLNVIENKDRSNSRVSVRQHTDRTPLANTFCEPLRSLAPKRQARPLISMVVSARAKSFNRPKLISINKEPSNLEANNATPTTSPSSLYT